MAILTQLGADDLRAVVVAYRDALRSHQEPINRLNVYPVPDGDTGTNMALTVESVVSALEGTPSDLAEVCKAIAQGSLMGARGNSGVILCQILRGLTATFAELDSVGASDMAGGLRAASEAAYQAVGRPVEGTILTVVREASEAAAEAAEADGATLAGVLEAALERGSASLQRTPELLEVLRQAGVVDAGGRGFLLLLDAALCVVSSRPVPEPATVAVGVAPGVESSSEGAGGHGDVSDLRYEVMYLLEAGDAAMEEFRATWGEVGDSIVVVGGDGLWNCHIHTDDIGAAVEAGIEAGRPHRIRVSDLAGEVEEERWVRQAASASDGSPAPVTEVVAVASGAGLHDLFQAQGANAVVTGGQSMNPSTAELLEAVEGCRADQVIILPNNANIVAVAEQVDALTSKVVGVVPTTEINSGLAALVAFDPRSGVEENAKAMAAAIDDLVAGEVTQAVRAYGSGAGHVAEGDWIGIGAEGITAVAADPAEATIALLASLLGDGHELVTVIVGDQAQSGHTERITAWLGEHHPGLEVEVHHGGQPLYPYLIGIE